MNLRLSSLEVTFKVMRSGFLLCLYMFYLLIEIDKMVHSCGVRDGVLSYVYIVEWLSRANYCIISHTYLFA
jgi:hypothetical protein